MTLDIIIILYYYFFKTATLKDVTDNLVLLRERNNQIDRRRLQYKWLLFPDLGVPSGIDDGVFNIPADEQFSAVKNIDFARDALHAATTLGIRESIITVDSLYDFITLTKSLKDHDLTVFDKLYEGSRWVTDVEFGRQMLNGVNPVVIRKCTILPANFPVTNEMVQQLFTRAATPVIEKMTLEKAMSVSFTTVSMCIIFIKIFTNIRRMVVSISVI